MSKRVFGLIGIAAAILFWATCFIMSSIRPEYFILTKAISELGSIEAPNHWCWNIFGYSVPGILIAIYSVGLYRNIRFEKCSKWPLYGILLSGIFMALSGIFPGDFITPESTTMLLHTVASFGSYVFFLIGAFTYQKLMNETNSLAIV